MCNKAWCYQNHGINRKLYSNTKVSVLTVPQAPQSCAKRAQNGLRVWRGPRKVWGQKEEDGEEKESKSVFIRAPLRASQCCYHSGLSTNKKQKQTITTKFSRQRQLTLPSTKRTMVTPATSMPSCMLAFSLSHAIFSFIWTWWRVLHG